MSRWSSTHVPTVQLWPGAEPGKVRSCSMSVPLAFGRPWPNPDGNAKIVRAPGAIAKFVVGSNENQPASASWIAWSSIGVVTPDAGSVQAMCWVGFAGFGS